MSLFPSKQPLESVGVDLLGPFLKTKTGNRFILVMADRFTELTQVVPLKRTTGLDVPKVFASHWVFKYGAPKEVLSDNGPQFAIKLYQNNCRINGISNTFTSAYHPQTNGQVDCFNRSIAVMLLCYVSDHPENWDEYAERLLKHSGWLFVLSLLLTVFVARITPVSPMAWTYRYVLTNL